VVSCAFSHNGKVLAVAGAAPTNTVAFIRTETGQILTMRDLAHPIRHISFSPVDDSLLCVSGQNYCRLLRREHHTVEELTLLDPEHEAGNSTCFTEHVWLNEHCIAASNTLAHVYIIEKGCLRQVLDCSPPQRMGYLIVSVSVLFFIIIF
jgi:hypothetical protein